jgi:hypothetical protein
MEESTYVNLTKSISIHFLIKILTSLILNPGESPHTFSNPKIIGLFFIQKSNPFILFSSKTTLDRISLPDLSFQNSCLKPKI